MGAWLLIAIFTTVAVTAGLVAILQRVNGQGPRRRNDSGDRGASSVHSDAGSRRDHDTADPSDSCAEGGGDGGGGD